jgi:hypothetical protein
MEERTIRFSNFEFLKQELETQKSKLNYSAFINPSIQQMEIDVSDSQTQTIQSIEDVIIPEAKESGLPIIVTPNSEEDKNFKEIVVPEIDVSNEIKATDIPESESETTLAAPEIPTAESETTLSAPEIPTAESETTLAAPEVPTAESETTLSAPEIPTAESETTLAPPEVPESESEATLAPPEVPTAESSEENNSIPTIDTYNIPETKQTELPKISDYTFPEYKETTVNYDIKIPEQPLITDFKNDPKQFPESTSVQEAQTSAPQIMSGTQIESNDTPITIQPSYIDDLSEFFTKIKSPPIWRTLTN